MKRAAAFAVLWRAARGRRPGAPGPVASAVTMPRLTRAVLTRRYDGTSPGRLGLLALAVLYIVSPVDVVPDLLPLLGVVDDVGVLAWLTGTVLAEADRFVAWERDEAAEAVRTGAPAAGDPHVVPGEVVR
jgi:uncharacterized membrane protein YkvA (DUF1232 family)